MSEREVINRAIYVFDLDLQVGPQVPDQLIDLKLHLGHLDVILVGLPSLTLHMDRVAALLLRLVVDLHTVIVPIPVHCEGLHLALALRLESARLTRLGLRNRTVVNAIGLIFGPVATLASVSQLADAAAAVCRRDALVHALFRCTKESDFKLLHALEELALAEHLLHVDVGEDILFAER